MERSQSAVLSILISIEYRETCGAFAATLLAAGEEPNSQEAVRAERGTAAKWCSRSPNIRTMSCGYSKRRILLKSQLNRVLARDTQVLEIPYRPHGAERHPSNF